MWKLSAAALAGAALALTGCSNSGATAQVTGKVTYNGQVVKAGVIYFKSDQGEYNAPLRDDGTYTFTDLPPGPVTVAVDTHTFDPDQRPVDYTKSQGGKAAKGGAKAAKIASGYGKSFSDYNKTAGGGQMAGTDDVTGGPSKETREKLAQVYVKLPEKYQSLKTSPLKYTVEPGSQTKDFDLTD